MKTNQSRPRTPTRTPDPLFYQVLTVTPLSPAPTTQGQLPDRRGPPLHPEPTEILRTSRPKPAHRRSLFPPVETTGEGLVHVIASPASSSVAPVAWPGPFLGCASRTSPLTALSPVPVCLAVPCPAKHPIPFTTFFLKQPTQLVQLETKLPVGNC